MEKLSAMSRTFFRDSVQQYVKSVEPVIVSQCCDMVKSYFSGIQEARVNIPHDSLMLVSPSAQHGTPNARQSSQHSEHMGNHNEDTVLPEACTDPMTLLTKVPKLLSEGVLAILVKMQLINFSLQLSR